MIETQAAGYHGYPGGRSVRVQKGEFMEAKQCRRRLQAQKMHNLMCSVTRPQKNPVPSCGNKRIGFTSRRKKWSCSFILLHGPNSTSWHIYVKRVKHTIASIWNIKGELICSSRTCEQNINLSFVKKKKISLDPSGERATDVWNETSVTEGTDMWVVGLILVLKSQSPERHTKTSSVTFQHQSYKNPNVIISSAVYLLYLLIIIVIQRVRVKDLVQRAKIIKMLNVTLTVLLHFIQTVKNSFFSLFLFLKLLFFKTKRVAESIRDENGSRFGIEAPVS